MAATTTMAIADGCYLWSEVDRLKAQVRELQKAARSAQEEQTRTTDYIASFVTHAQLDAALSTKISQVSVGSHLERLRNEINKELAEKADVEVLLALQAKKLDVSVFESSAWDLQKFRTALEQHVRDLFASFAGKIEHQIDSKLAIEDFNRIFNPDANGQKAALDDAATRISRMTEQLTTLQDYVSGDRQRQKQVAELNVALLDLTRKQTASRNAIVQLQSAEEAAETQLSTLNEQVQHAAKGIQALTQELADAKAQAQQDKCSQDAKQEQLEKHAERLEAQKLRLSHELGELQRFAHQTLVETMDGKLKLGRDELHGRLTDLNAAQLKHEQQEKVRANRTRQQLLQHKEQLLQVDARLRELATTLREAQKELDTVKGPLATLACNLREENVAILEEIERSQNGSRNLMLDYQDLLEKEQRGMLSLPSRPSSSAANSSANGSASASRKHKQQMLLATRAANGSTNRPHTSSPRMRSSSLPDASCSIVPRSGKSASAVRGGSNSSSNSNSRTPPLPWRAQTAGAVPKVPTKPPHTPTIRVNITRPNNDNGGISSDKVPDPEREATRMALPLSTQRANTHARSGGAISSLLQPGRDEELFHFPLSVASPETPPFTEACGALPSAL